MTDNDIIPMVDSRFRTIADKVHRAITLAHSGVFTSMGMFSGGTISMDDIKAHPDFAKEMKLVFFSFGSRELDWHLAH